MIFLQKFVNKNEFIGGKKTDTKIQDLQMKNLKNGYKFHTRQCFVM